MDNRRSPEIVFFGKITAGITHELKNVLAIIKETSGLIGDLVHLSGSKTIDQEKLQKSLSTIEKQVQRGVALLSHLNKFAHSPDKEESEINLVDIVNETAILSDRYTRLKNIRLNIHPPDRTITFTTCQVSLHMTLFSCLEYCISRLPQEAQIDIFIHPDDKIGVLITFECSSELLDVPDRLNEQSIPNDIENQVNTGSLVKAKVQKTSHGVQLILPSTA